ncbi:MAG: alpha/beta fold hydrolase [Gammaproteobacteria bacterium]|nr:alpha/beta fold hydrolase [Gammaproteobacteria bacterium]
MSLSAIKTTSFSPDYGLHNPHLQSVLSNIGLRRRQVLHAFAHLRDSTKALIVPCADDVQLLAHYTPAVSGGPLVLLIHGWEGSAESIYLLSAAATFHAAGYSVLRLNLRDHGDSHHLNKDLFHSCRLQEVLDAVAWAQQRFRPSELLLGGFSLGGNFAVRVAAAADDEGLSIDRVLAVCPVLDPAVTMHALDTGWFIYRRHFIHKWRNSLMKKMQAFPQTYDFKTLRNFNNLTEMTAYFVDHYTDYPDVYDYLGSYALTGGRLAKLSIDTRMLLADDDPVIPVSSLDEIAVTDALQVRRTKSGGHCGYLSNWRLHSWINDWLLQESQPS